MSICHWFSHIETVGRCQISLNTFLSNPLPLGSECYHLLQSAFAIEAVFICGSGFSKQIRNAAHETDHIPIKTVLISQLAVYSNWTLF